ncbi:MAG: ABC transporter ATP-binding protein [Terracidiphilus sp.]
MLTSSDGKGQFAIRCESIGKHYRIGAPAAGRTLRDTISEMFRAPLQERPQSPNDTRDLWALRDLSLEVSQGEVLGIIGRNGSGKSTLLKILSRITKPTEGHAEIRGRVGSLLEVGAGFHPELTGRDNIFLNGAILGMTRREIERKFDEIVDFSECGRFLDTPIKHYSSGMYVRLAFAVAAHLETEILLVDEVLAVGDAVFQKKCLGKIGDTVKQGRTVLFISHNMTAVDGLCTRAICLHEGRVVLEGPAASVTSRYLQNWFPGPKEVVHQDIETAPGNNLIRLHRARVRPLDDSPAEQLTVRTPFAVEFECWKLATQSHLSFTAEVYNEHGVEVFATTENAESPAPAGLLRISFIVPADLMNNGRYTVRLAVYLNGISSAALLDWEDLLAFEIHDAASELRGSYHGHWPGAVRPNFKWKTELLEPLPGVFGAQQGRD